LSTRVSDGKFAEQVDDAVTLALYEPAMFAGGVGALGLPPHAINDATAVPITSHFILVILASKPGPKQLIAGSGV
jgi:hypothetical protein